MTVADPERKLEQSILAEAGWVRRLARSLVRDEGAAADLAQDVLTTAIEKRPHRLGRLRGWLGGITRRLAARRHRERLAREKREAQAARPLADNQEEEAVERVRLHRRLTDAVLSLPEPYRTVVIARFFDGLPPRAIAQRRDVSPAVIRQQLHRGLAMLRARLDREFGSRRAWGAALVGLLEDPLTTAAPVLFGAYVMKKIAAAALAVLLLVVAYRVLTPSTSSPAPVPTSHQSGAIGAVPEEAAPDAVRVERVALEGELARTAAGTGELLTGTVVDHLSNPVGGIALRFEPEQQGHRADPGPVVTEPDGSFAIGRPGVSGRILADDPAWTTLLAGTTTWDDRPVWVVVAGAARIAGTVVHADGSPVPAVRVVVELPVGFRTRFDFPLENSEDRSWKGLTDDRGFFQLADVPLMEGCRITWTKVDYAPEKRELRRDERELHVVLRPLVAEGGELRGVVLDDAGQPVRDAEVALGRQIRRTAEDGGFRFLLADPDADRLFAVAEGWMPVVSRREPVGWPDYVELRFARRPLELAGRVLDEAGRPHSGAVVWVEDLTYFGAARAAEHAMQGGATVWRRASTDDEGRFEIPDLMDREYRVRAMDRRTTLMTPSGTARAGTDGLVLQFPAGSVHRAVTGQVRDSLGRPVSDLSISVRRETFRLHSPEHGGMRFLAQASGAHTTSDADGQFRLEDVPREGVYLSLRGQGVITKRFTFPDDRVPVRFDILVERACRIRIDLAGSEYAAADGARVLNVRGEPLSMERISPDLTTVEERTKLVEGRSEVVVVPDSAVEVLILHGDEELGRLPVRPDPERLVTVRR